MQFLPVIPPVEVLWCLVLHIVPQYSEYILSPKARCALGAKGRNSNCLESRFSSSLGWSGTIRWPQIECEPPVPSLPSAGVRNRSQKKNSFKGVLARRQLTFVEVFLIYVTGLFNIQIHMTLCPFINLASMYWPLTNNSHREWVNGIKYTGIPPS